MELSSREGMAPNSVSTIFYVYRCLREGLEFTRKISLNNLELLFHGIKKDDGRYGIDLAIQSVELHIKSFERNYNLKCVGYRKIIDKYTGFLRDAPVEYGDIEKEFSDKVYAALQDTAAVRLERLAKAQKKPIKKISYVLTYNRNVDVVAEVIYRSNGVCGNCKSPAPFNRVNGVPYLEVHHIKPLSKGGEDSVKNTIALCPNCHRNMHHGLGAVKSSPRSSGSGASRKRSIKVEK